MAVHSAPQSMRLAVDANDDFVQVLFVAKLRRAPTDGAGEVPTELLGPAPDSLVPDEAPAGCQPTFDHAQAEVKTKVESDGLRNDFGGKAVVAEAGMSNGADHSRLPRNIPRPVNVTVPFDYIEISYNANRKHTRPAPIRGAHLEASRGEIDRQDMDVRHRLLRRSRLLGARWHLTMPTEGASTTSNQSAVCIARRLTDKPGPVHPTKDWGCHSRKPNRHHGGLTPSPFAKSRLLWAAASRAFTIAAAFLFTATTPVKVLAEPNSALYQIDFGVPPRKGAEALDGVFDRVMIVNRWNAAEMRRASWTSSTIRRQMRIS